MSYDVKICFWQGIYLYDVCHFSIFFQSSWANVLRAPFTFVLKNANKWLRVFFYNMVSVISQRFISHKSSSHF